MSAIAIFVMWASAVAFAASDHVGRITIQGLPVPGATVIATQGDQRVVAISDVEGVYRFTNLADGVWSVRVEMSGFIPASRQVTVPADAPTIWEMEIAPLKDTQCPRHPRTC